MMRIKSEHLRGTSHVDNKWNEKSLSSFLTWETRLFFVEDVVERDEYNRIVIDPWTQKTSAKNVWAAGDCTNIKYHQNNISAGDGVKALEDIYVSLKTQ